MKENISIEKTMKKEKYLTQKVKLNLNVNYLKIKNGMVKEKNILMKLLIPFSSI
jgi:hypothetical protein